MRVRSVGKHAWQLTRLGLVNAYLVRESDSWTLIDTMIPGSAKKIVTAARAQDRRLIARVLLTHAHGDHIGSLDKVVAALGQVDVAISARDARLLPKKPAQDRSLDSGEPACKLKGSFPGQNTRPSHLIGDDELFGSLRCVATPGHTPGHFSYFDERDGTLFAGDALFCLGGELIVSGFGPRYFPFTRWVTWHRPTAVDSARRLLELPIRRFCAGHGRVIEGGTELLRAAVQKAERKLK